MFEIRAGVDIGKEHHHCVVLDAHGTRLLSRRIRNDESELLELIRDVLVLADQGEVLWAVDASHGCAALLIGLLLAQDQPMAYLTGPAVHHASAGYRGQGKTDARDAHVIADQARMRRDLGLLRPGDEIAVDLRILIGRRTDLVSDSTRQTNRLHAPLLTIFPAFERALTPKGRGLVTLLTGYETPAAIRRVGARRLESWLRRHHVRNAAAVAQTAVEAAHAQTIVLPGEDLAAVMVARLAQGALAPDAEIAEVDTLIEAHFHQHPHAKVIDSMPGMGFRVAPSSWPRPAVTWQYSARRTAWPPSPAWLRCPAIRAVSTATCTGPAAITAVPAGLLPGRHAQPAHLPRLTALLPAQTHRREEPRPGRAGPRPSQAQRPLGDDPRSHLLRTHPTNSARRGLTSYLGSS